MRKPAGDWKDIFNGFSVALDVRKMWLGLQGIVVTLIILTLVTVLYCHFYVGSHWGEREVSETGRTETLATPEYRTLKAAKSLLTSVRRVRISDAVNEAGVFLGGALAKARDEFYTIREYNKGRPYSLAHDILVSDAAAHIRLLLSFWVIVCLLSWIAWSYYGGAISRIAAVELATEGDRIELSEAKSYAIKNYSSYFWSPMTVFLAILFLALCNAVAGLTVRNVLATGVGVLGAFAALSLLIYVREKSNLATGAGVGVAVAIVTAVLCWLLAKYAPATTATGSGGVILALGKLCLSLLFSLVLLSAFLLVLLRIGLCAPAIVVGLVLAALCGIGMNIFHRLPAGAQSTLLGFFPPSGGLSTFMLFLLVTGGAIGFNLMLAAVSVDGSESFDAISRAFSYVYARPWRYILYHLIAVLYGTACVIFVGFLVKVAISTAVVTAWIGAGSVPGGFGDIVAQLFEHGSNPTGWVDGICGVLISIPVLLVVGMFWGFVVSLFITLKTIIYYLLRKSVDADEVTSYYQPEEDAEPAPKAAAPAQGTAAQPDTPPGGEAKTEKPA